MTKYKYPKEIANHENEFGLQLLSENKEYKIAYYASNLYDVYIGHIGYNQEQLIDRVSKFDIFTNKEC
jgi:hypothetical protein